MGTRQHPEAPGYPYFITFATHERQPILKDPAAARLLVDQLFALRGELGFLLLGYVVMPDHVHVVIVPHADAPLAKVMQFVKGRFARIYNGRSGRAGRLWQPRYYEAVIRDEAALLRRMRYMKENPVRAGLAVNPEDYPFSSAIRATDLDRYLSPEPSAVAPG
ncbi:MAG: transposase [Dehalococcoidia bacterium]|nr:transposase [Dehalococcoidia bacterium]